jgi:hypothetical protein
MAKSRTKRPRKTPKAAKAAKTLEDIWDPEEDKAAAAEMVAALTRMRETSHAEDWHRKPALNENEWRAGIGKQLDALGLAVDAALAVLVKQSSTTSRVIDHVGRLIELTGSMATELKEMGKLLKELDARTSVKAPKKWRLDVDKMLARLVVLSRLAQTIQAIFGDGHKQLPP